MTEKTEQERDEFEIATVEETDRLTPGTWVIDADGDALCLVDTHMGFPQRMWMVKARKGRVSLLVDLPSATISASVASTGAARTRWGTATSAGRSSASCARSRSPTSRWLFSGQRQHITHESTERSSDDREDRRADRGSVAVG